MRNTYVDRGITKWNAFDALVGYRSMLEEMKHRLGKKERLLLSEDAYDELNQKLVIALREGKKIEIRYYHDGYIRFTFGSIKHVDYDNKQIILSTRERLSAEDIVAIDFV